MRSDWWYWWGAPSIVAFVACGPSSSADGDGDGTGSDTASSVDGGPGQPGTAEGSASGDSGGPGACPPTAVWAVPGCSEPMGFGAVPLPEAGCYEVCDEGDSSQCSVGACVITSVDPCAGSNAPCDACSAEQWLCVPGEPLGEGFEADLPVVGGCGLSTFGVFAANEAGDIVLGASLNEDLIMPAQMSGTTQQATYTLEDPAAQVWASVGPNVSGNQCTDAPLGTQLRSYRATAGTVDVTVDPPSGGVPGSDQAIATVVLTGVVLEDTQGAGDPVTVASFSFDMVNIWCCPG